MSAQINERYKKAWLVTTAIAKMLIAAKVGDQIPTIQEYVDILSSSRGVVQNALQTLQNEGAITLEKRGKMGSIITEIDTDSLFSMSGISFITGSMPMPFNDPLIGIATGVSISMGDCTIPFSFAFVQGGVNRVNALLRGMYDFVILSKCAALYHVTANPNIEIALTLEGCVYSKQYVFCSFSKEITKPMDGMIIAADPKATDQFKITSEMCKGKNIELVQCAFSACISMFLERKVDGIVYHKDEWTKAEGIWTHPIENFDEAGLYTPALLTTKNNHAVGHILRAHLFDSDIAKIQEEVTNKKRHPQFC